MPGLPPLTGGMVGFVSWDAVRRWERVPDTTVDELGVPELSMSLATDLAVLDHSDATVLLVANAVNYDDTDERVDEAWADAVARLDRMTAGLAAPAPSTVAVFDPPPGRVPARERSARSEYLAAVAEGKEAIRDGEVFQVVLAQRFDLDCPADALDVYRVLRASNPSPVHVPVPHRRPGRAAAGRRRFQPGGAGEGGRRPGDHPPDRRHPATRGDPGAGRRPRRRAARRREGAGRAPDAGRPGAQRPGPGVRAGRRSRWSTSCRWSATAT